MDTNLCQRTIADLIDWIRQKQAAIGSDKAVIGISGGKDSTVTAALMARALAPERVFGVLMPDGRQPDLADARAVCDHLGIRSAVIPIQPMTDAFKRQLKEQDFFGELSRQTLFNLPPRVRMTLLYAVAQSIPGSLVINTSNLSEDWVGYATIYGDTAGAYAPLGMLVTDEVVAVGRELGLPEYLLIKPPADGLTGRTDEDVLGFSYAQLNRYLRQGQIDDPNTKKRIDAMHRQSRFKFLPIPMFDPGLPIQADDIAGVYYRRT